jgi:hypothetical protein
MLQIVRHPGTAQKHCSAMQNLGVLLIYFGAPRFELARNGPHDHFAKPAGLAQFLGDGSQVNFHAVEFLGQAQAFDPSGRFFFGVFPGQVRQAAD